jgi:hypothetical protein
MPKSAQQVELIGTREFTIEHIKQDVVRTFPDLQFFQRHIEPSDSCPIYTTLKSRKNSLSRWIAPKRSISSEREMLILGRKPQDPDYHWEALERILYIYAKANPDIGYIQGMNFLVAPLYYVCVNDPVDANKCLM